MKVDLAVGGVRVLLRVRQMRSDETIIRGQLWVM